MNKKILVMGMILVLAIGIVGCSAGGAEGEEIAFDESEFAPAAPSEDTDKTKYLWSYISTRLMQV